MHSRLRDNIGVYDPTFNEKNAKRVRFDDLTPGFDRLEKLSVFPAKGGQGATNLGPLRVGLE